MKTADGVKVTSGEYYLISTGVRFAVVEVRQVLFDGPQGGTCRVRNVNTGATGKRLSLVSDDQMLCRACFSGRHWVALAGDAVVPVFRVYGNRTLRMLTSALGDLRHAMTGL
jgi:hypothetical protein